MRLVNIFSALTGAFALIALAALRHGAAGADYSAILTAGLIQLSAAAAGLAVAGRSGRLNLLGATLMLAGANLFATVIYLNAVAPGHPLHALAPVGGALAIVSWIVLAFAAPTRQ